MTLNSARRVLAPTTIGRLNTVVTTQKRLLPLGLITLEDIQAGTKELERCAKKGIRGAMIWADAPDDRPYSHTDYDPFWAAASDLNMPLSLHILNRSQGNRTRLF